MDDPADHPLVIDPRHPARGLFGSIGRNRERCASLN